MWYCFNMPYRTIPENRKARFMARVEIRENGCWYWLGAINKTGYGVSSIDGQKTLAHRAFWIFENGQVPEGMDLDHLCRNRACINPEHLEVVTRSVNLRRGFEARGCRNGHKFNNEDFSIVHRSDGTTERRCKVCHRANNKRVKARKRIA